MADEGDAAPARGDAPPVGEPAASGELDALGDAAVDEPAAVGEPALTDASAPVDEPAAVGEPAPVDASAAPGAKRPERRSPPSFSGPLTESSRSHADPRQRTPWTRALFALTIVGPALAIGGVPPEVVIGFAGVVLVLWIRLGRRTRGWLEIPWPAWLGALAAIVTAIQAAPLPGGLRELLAPGIVDRVSAALAGSGIAAWPSISPTPGDTGLEAARLALLTLLFIVSAQLPWRTTAALVSAAGATVAGVGLVQGALGMSAILGVYRPHDVDPAATPALLTTFVNPNHQADLFLLALFAAGALLVRGRPREGAETRSEARLLLWAVLLVVGAALILSLSRGALLALAIAAPPALGFAWLSGQPLPGTRRRDRWLPRLGALALVGAAAAAIARAGAWAELMTVADDGHGIADKLAIAGDALALHALAPVLGIGRGAFIDLFPAVDPASAVVIHTHLESAPAALWIEWGWFGAGLGVAFIVAWIDALRRAGRRSDGGARRVALCGLAAVALHSVGDFSLEFLGVAAPAVALAGALAGRGRRVPVRGATLVGALVGGAALAAALVAAPHTWSKRAGFGDSSAPPDPAALRLRPLDAHLHRDLARAALEAGEPARARPRAEAASALRPGEPETWLLRAAAERDEGDLEAAAASLRRALDLITSPPPPPIASYLLGQVDQARELAALMPDDPRRWAAIIEGLVAVDPGAALAVAVERIEAPLPEGAPVLELQASAALHAGEGPLAIHYARLLVAAAPERAGSHLLLVKALEWSVRPRRAEILGVLRDALAIERIDDPAERGLIEEALVERLLLAAEDPEADLEGALAEAQALLPTLRERPGDRPALQRRALLGRRADALAEARRAP